MTGGNNFGTIIPTNSDLKLILNQNLRFANLILWYETDKFRFLTIYGSYINSNQSRY